MILKGIPGKLFVNLLRRLPVFNRHCKVVRFGEAYKIYRSVPADRLRQTAITPANILRFKFGIYDAFAILKEHVAEIRELDEERNELVIDVWESEKMQKLIKSFRLPLTKQTFSELKDLLSKDVFPRSTRANYHYFMAVWLHHEIAKAADTDRRYAEGTIKYSVRKERGEKESRLKSKFSLTKQEALAFCAEVSYWEAEEYNQVNNIT